MIGRMLARCIRSVYGRLFDRSLEQDISRIAQIDDLRANTALMEHKIRCVSALLSGKHLHVEQVSRCAQEGSGWIHNEIFILGSGSSLLDLTQGERDELAKLPTIAMNKYLLYWDIIGIWPTYVFLADFHQPAPEVLTRCVELFAQSDYETLPCLLLSKDYENWPLSALHPIFFPHTPTAVDMPWSDSMDEPMYFHRGSLTTLLNLVTVLKFAPKVTLLGVDLDDGKPFYAKRYDTDSTLHDYWENLRRDTGTHPTALEYCGIPPVQAKLPWVFDRMRERGVAVECYSKRSLLVKNALCPLREPIDKNC